MNNHRICIRDLPGNVTNINNELKILIEKICPVVGIYLPSLTLTGIRRDFAIVTVNADIESVKKCVKVFNNCHWKGGKIKVDLAKEYYKDRLKREREEVENTDNESINNDDDEVNNIDNNGNDLKDNITSEIKHKNEFIVVPKDYITLKKVRSGKRIMISTIPSLFPLKSKFQKIKINNVNSNTKPKNKKQNNDDNIIIYNCGWKISFDDNGNPIKPDVSIEMDTNIINDNNNNNDNKNDTDLINNNSDNNNKITVNIENVKEGGGGIRRGFGTLITNSNSDKKEVKSVTTDKQNISDDCGCLPTLNEMPENDFTENDPNLSDDDDIPCVSELELKEENLAKERTRMNTLLLSVLGIESSPYTNSENASININKIQGKTWGDVFIKRYDPTKEDSKRYEMDYTDEKDIDNVKENNDIEDDEEDKDVEDEDDDDNNYNFNENSHSSNSHTNSIPIGSSTAIANTTALKNIFYKEDGGVWWGDDGTLKQTVGKGDAATDVIFREAEKLGIDVRSDSNEANMMKFSFFGDDNINDIQDNNDNQNDKNNNYNEVSNVNNNKNDNEIIKVQPPMTLIDIVKNAKKFQRDKSIEELRQNWLDTRDKLKIDYKRKKKDDKKKKGLNIERSPYNRNDNNSVSKIKIDNPSVRKIKSRRGGVKNKKSKK